MKKILLLISAVIMMSVSGLAQGEIHYGIFVGASGNWMNVDSKLYYDDSQVYTEMISETECEVSYLTVNDAKVKPNFGLVLGGLFEYKATKMFGLQFELMYNKYGYKLEGNVQQPNLTDEDYTTYSYKANTSMDNFSAALFAKLYFLDDHLSVDLGVRPSFCFRMTKATERGINHKTVVYDSDKEFSPFSVSAIGGVTYNFLGNIFVSARYSLSFMDVIKAKTPYIGSGVEADPNEILYKYEDAKSRASSISLTVGYRIR